MFRHLCRVTCSAEPEVALEPPQSPAPHSDWTRKGTSRPAGKKVLHRSVVFHRATFYESSDRVRDITSRWCACGVGLSPVGAWFEVCASARLKVANTAPRPSSRFRCCTSCVTCCDDHAALRGLAGRGLRDDSDPCAARAHGGRRVLRAGPRVQVPPPPVLPAADVPAAAHGGRARGRDVRRVRGRTLRPRAQGDAGRALRRPGHAQ
eukprot:scaffold59394_cov66-Phaeocystis_antarctica.AAC.1